jgi:hypothetical protein
MSPEAQQLDPVVPVTLPLGRPYQDRRPSHLPVNAASILVPMCFRASPHVLRPFG